ncbi:sulfatase [Exilibacterium tricleocarpae]|uniref:Sulfatase n=1 Tax=Exilibacterium tricleocarpae TaxID=2591008 RepID=A0A545UA45_9GAMM|nr:sulfatase [Exilibacterium tricleocarpae]
MRRLAAAGLVLGLLSLAGAAQAKKNVIFILSDDHRYDFMSFIEAAPDFLSTPALDRMAAEGMHLRNAFVTTSLCSPSRASILTGQYAHRHGVVDNSSPVPQGTRFFPRDLQKVGYRTAFIGKWHMGEEDDRPRPGFDHWVSFRGQGVYENPTLNVNGRRVERRGYVTDLLTDYAVEWLQSQRGSKAPFFLYLSHKAVHAEFIPAPRHLGRYGEAKTRFPATMANTERNYRGKPKWVREQRYSWHGVDYPYHGQLDDFDGFYRRYAETLLAVDDSVARLLAYLGQHDLAKDTLVMYMGDNGFLLGEHGLIDKRNAYEASIRVPMLAWAPGFIRAGTVADTLVRNIDVAPTLLALAGADTSIATDGESFLPLLRGRPRRSLQREFLYEYYWEHAFPHTPTTFALRGERFKYIYYHGVWDRAELYDLEADPEERHNLAEIPAFVGTAKTMHERLFDRLEADNAMQVPLRRSHWQAGERLLGK